MRRPTLRSRVLDLLRQDPGRTTPQLYELLKAEFPDDNPRWMRSTIHAYKWQWKRRSNFA